MGSNVHAGIGNRLEHCSCVCAAALTASSVATRGEGGDATHSQLVLLAHRTAFMLLRRSSLSKPCFRALLGMNALSSPGSSSSVLLRSDSPVRFFDSSFPHRQTGWHGDLTPPLKKCSDSGLCHDLHAPPLLPALFLLFLLHTMGASHSQPNNEANHITLAAPPSSLIACEL